MELLLGTALIAAVLWLVAPLVVWAAGGTPDPRARLWLVAAIGAVAISGFLPNPLLTEHTNSFTQHVVGGGIASALVGYYLAHHARRSTGIQRGLLVLAVASVLGVANELFELLLDQVRGTAITSDTPWDLLANTIGAAVGFVAIEVARRVRAAVG